MAYNCELEKLQEMRRPLRNVTIAFVWDQLGPYHVDRCDAVASHLGTRVAVCGVQVADHSLTYAWDPTYQTDNWRKITLTRGAPAETVSWPTRFFLMLKYLNNCDVVFLSGYHRPENFLIALWFLVIKRRSYIMSDSKFDDRQRFIFRELSKLILCLPYHGALVAGPRHKSYFNFLNFIRRPVVMGYDTVNVSRVGFGESHNLSIVIDFHQRPFIFVGRFVEKKNLVVLIRAFGQYKKINPISIRKLVLVGAGHLEQEIRNEILDQGIDDFVDFRGFLQTAEVSLELSASLALILPSAEEQWGLVINEAISVNLPIICSQSCGAKDTLVFNHLNGYAVEHDNVIGFARAMADICKDEARWQKMRDFSKSISNFADTIQFAAGVASLIAHS